MIISDLVCFKKEECLRPHLVKSITLVCKGCEIALGSHTIQTVPKYIWMQQCYRIYFIVAGRGGAVPTKNGPNTPCPNPHPPPPPLTPQIPTLSNQNVPGPPFCNFSAFSQVPSCWRERGACHVYGSKNVSWTRNI